MSRSIFILGFLIFLLVDQSQKIKGDLLCEKKGKCQSCKGEDMFQDYCKETGRMVLYVCNDGSQQYEEYKSCPLSSDDEQAQVIAFQICMAIIGGLTYWAAQRRKLNTMSLFDSRKRR